jgi:rare lipoprotein A
LSGKHADARPSWRSNRFVPLLSALALAGVLVGAAAGAMNLGPASDPQPAAAAAAATSPSVLLSRGTDDRASRSGLRALPSPVASTTSAAPGQHPSPTPTKAKPTQPSGGAVTSSGTCGVSYYSDGEHTANGENFDPNALTAASKTLPFNTRVRVTNPANGKSVVVRINDRGPYVSGRCLDLTKAAFAAIASLGAGVLSSARWEVLS